MRFLRTNICFLFLVTQVQLISLFAISQKQNLKFEHLTTYDGLVRMPETDGLEATQILRSQLISQPVIIAMTANAMEGDEDTCLAAGMNDYISKVHTF